MERSQKFWFLIGTLSLWTCTLTKVLPFPFKSWFHQLQKEKVVLTFLQVPWESPFLKIRATWNSRSLTSSFTKIKEWTTLAIQQCAKVYSFKKKDYINSCICRDSLYHSLGQTEQKRIQHVYNKCRTIPTSFFHVFSKQAAVRTGFSPNRSSSICLLNHIKEDLISLSESNDRYPFTFLHYISWQLIS